MDIHKPKRWHGFSEFLKEFGTIVVGVLVALGAEQGVEWLHRQHQVHDARNALHAEIADDMGRALFNRRREVCGAPFIDKYLVPWAAGGPPPPVTAGGSELVKLNASNWDVVKTGAAAYMPLNERLALAHFYDGVADYNTMIERERAAGLALTDYLGPQQMTPADRDALSRTISGFRNLGLFMENMADGISQDGKALGVRASIPRGPSDELEDFCRQAGVN